VESSHIEALQREQSRARESNISRIPEAATNSSVALKFLHDGAIEEATKDQKTTNPPRPPLRYLALFCYCVSDPGDGCIINRSLLAREKGE
jgi:hypothetical protein